MNFKQSYEKNERHCSASACVQMYCTFQNIQEQMTAKKGSQKNS